MFKRRGAAGAGQAVAVDQEEGVLDLDFREGLAGGIQALPMGGGAIAVQQAERARTEAPGIHGAEIGAGTVQPQQPGFDAAVAYRRSGSNPAQITSTG